MNSCENNINIILRYEQTTITLFFSSIYSFRSSVERTHCIHTMDKRVYDWKITTKEKRTGFVIYEKATQTHVCSIYTWLIEEIFNVDRMILVLVLKYSHWYARNDGFVAKISHNLTTNASHNIHKLLNQWMSGSGCDRFGAQMSVLKFEYCGLFSTCTQMKMDVVRIHKNYAIFMLQTTEILPYLWCFFFFQKLCGEYALIQLST